MKNPTKTIEKEILEIVRELPGATPAVIADLMPHVKLSSIQPAVSRMYAAGWFTREEVAIKRSNGIRKTFAYTANAERRPPVIERKRKAPTDAGMKARIAQLEAENAELRAWRVEAEQRFPDLKVPPVVIRARQIVAETLRSDGDTRHAQEVLSGAKDCSPMVRAVIHALGDE